MVHLIDTSILTDMERHRLSFDDLAAADPVGPAAIAAITASELPVEVHRADRVEVRRRRELFVEGILEILPVFPFDVVAARTHARSAAHLLSSGSRIGANDILLAATAIASNYSLLASNSRAFLKNAGLAIYRPDW